MVAIATTEILPEWEGDPMIWTKNRKPFYCRRVFIVATQTQKGRNSLRFYPLAPRPDGAYPSYLVCRLDSSYVLQETTHVILKHRNIAIVRPLKMVYYAMKWSLRRGEVDITGDKLLTLVKHLYFTDNLSDKKVAEIEKKYTLYANIISRAASTDFAGEKEVCMLKAWQIINKIEADITDLIKKGGLI
jgi:hypothetical protein